jgi:hypothetical protein
VAVDAVLFIPCCARKSASGTVIRPPYPWPEPASATAWQAVEHGRQRMSWAAKQGSQPTSALLLYQGWLYRDLRRDALLSRVNEGRLRVFVVSAGYGILDALEPALDYDAEMKGRVAREWRGEGLSGAISTLCQTLQPRQVYGFFAGSARWGGTAAMYRYFYTEGVRLALLQGLRPAMAGCFYRRSGDGTSAILRALGRCLNLAIDSGPSPCFARDVAHRPMSSGGIEVGFDSFLPLERRDPM